jgi:alpha-amylase
MKFVIGFISAILLATPTLANVEKNEIRPERIYFVMVDRFENGDPTNDRGLLQGDRSITGFDLSDPGFFHGGDLKGLIKRIDYIASLGFTAIWITPVARQVTVSPTAESAAYHGYWGAGFDEVDPHFGTMEDMKEFVNKAHDAGLKVYLDVVLNHTGDVISYKEGEAYVSLNQSPYRTKDGKKFNPIKVANTKLFPALDQLSISTSFPKQVLVNEKIKKSPDWLNDPRNYHNRGNSGGSGESSLYGDFYGLDDLFTESPAVLDGWIEVFGKWISEVGVDGFRVDTFRHVNHEFWLQFLPKMREIAQGSGKTYFPMWGEIYDSDPGRISDWIKRSDLQEVLDFPIQNAITGFILDEEAQQLATAFDNDDLYITKTSKASNNGTFLGNHDMGRIGGFISNRFADQEVALAKSELAHALLYSIRGIPIVYYGDEFGLIGGRDKAARQSLFPTQIVEWQKQARIGSAPIGTANTFDTSNPLQASIRTLSKLRDEFPSLQSGPQKIRFAKNSTIAISRFDKSSNTELLFIFNSGTKLSKIALTSLGLTGVSRSELTRKIGSATLDAKELTVPALSWSVFTRKVNASKAKTAIELLKPTLYKYDPSIVFLRAKVQGSEFAEVEFQSQVKNGDWQSLGSDNSPIFAPTTSNDVFRVAPTIASFGKATSIKFRAVLLENSGRKLISSPATFRLNANSR